MSSVKPRKGVASVIACLLQLAFIAPHRFNSFMERGKYPSFKLGWNQN